MYTYINANIFSSKLQIILEDIISKTLFINKSFIIYNEMDSFIIRLISSITSQEKIL